MKGGEKIELFLFFISSPRGKKKKKKGKGSTNTTFSSLTSQKSEKK